MSNSSFLYVDCGKYHHVKKSTRVFPPSVGRSRRRLLYAVLGEPVLKADAVIHTEAWKEQVLIPSRCGSGMLASCRFGRQWSKYSVHLSGSCSVLDHHSCCWCRKSTRRGRYGRMSFWEENQWRNRRRSLWTHQLCTLSLLCVTATAQNHPYTPGIWAPSDVCTLCIWVGYSFLLLCFERTYYTGQLRSIGKFTVND